MASKALEKAWKSPNIGKHGKRKATIIKEKARELFEFEQLKRWQKISEKQAKDALRNRQAREYSINQVIGKPTETVKVEEDITIKLDA